MGPDAESAQWVAQAAEVHGWDRGVCSKLRHGDDREVEVALPAGLAVQAGRWCWSTMWRAPATLWRAPPKPADGRSRLGGRVAVTHALFAGDALETVRRAGVGEVWSTDCVPHPRTPCRWHPCSPRHWRR